MNNFYRRTILVVGRICLLLGVSASIIYADESNNTVPASIAFNFSQGPISFVEFTLNDLGDPALGGSLRADELVMIEINGEQKIMHAKDFLIEINGIERRLSEVGKSLRNEQNTLSIATVPNPELWMRELRRDLDLNLEGLVNSYIGGERECPLIELGALGLNPQTGRAWAADDMAVIPKQGKVRVADLLPKLNNEQRAFCQVGLSLLDKVQPESQEFLKNVLVERVNLLSGLKIEPGSALSEVAKWANTTSIEEIQSQFKELEEAIKKPSPAKLYNLAQKAGSLDPALRLPEIPNIPAPQVTKRVDLKLRKRYEWPGFDTGNRDIASAYGNAWAELRSGKSGQSEAGLIDEQALQAEATFGLYLINNQINLVGATLDSGMTPQSAKAEFKYCYLDVCTTKSGGIKDFGINEGDPKALDKNWDKSYSQQIVVGIVPVVLRLGGKFSAVMGWGVGLNLLGVNGNVNGSLAASAMGEAAVGLQDFIEAGCGGEITLIKDTITINGNAGVKFLSDDQPTIEASLVGDNELRALDGRVYAYALVDALGPLGDLVNKVIDTLKALGNGELEDFVNRLGEASEIGKKLVDNLESAGRSIQGAWNMGVKNVKQVFKGCCRVKFSAVPALAGSSPFGGTSIHGTKIRYEHDWANWHGLFSKNRFLNYKLYIGPDGKEFGGNLGNYEENSSEIASQNISLAQREAQVGALETALAAKHLAVLRDVQTFLASEATQAIGGLPQALEVERVRRTTALSEALRPFRSGT